MTETQKLLEEVREKMGGITYYKVAQVLDIERSIIHYYACGERAADAYACTKFAEVLGRDPLAIIALVESKSARSEKKRKYWESFISFGMHNSLGLLLSGTLVSLGAGWPAGNAEAGIMTNSHNGGLRKMLRRLTQRRSAWRSGERRRLAIN